MWPDRKFFLNFIQRISWARAQRNPMEPGLGPRKVSPSSSLIANDQKVYMAATFAYLD